MNEHQRLREMLAYRAELSPVDARRLSAHLAGCPECSALAESYARQAQMLRALPLSTPPQHLRAGVLNRVHEPPPTRRWFTRRPMWLAAPLTVAIALAVAFGLTHRTHQAPHTALQHTPQVIRATPTPAALTIAPRRGSPVPTVRRRTPGAGYTPRPTGSLPQSQTVPPTVALGGPTNTAPPVVVGPPVLGQVVPPTATALTLPTAPPTQAPVPQPVHPSPTQHRPPGVSPTAATPVLIAPVPNTKPPTAVPQSPLPSAPPVASPVPAVGTPVPSNPPVLHPTIAAGLRPTPGPPSPAANTTPTVTTIQQPIFSAQPTPTAPLPPPLLPTPVAPPAPQPTPTP